MEVKVQAFHRQIFEKSITLFEFRERQAVRICIYLTAKVYYFAHYKKRALEIIGNPSGFKGFTIFRSVLFCGILWHFEG